MGFNCNACGAVDGEPELMFGGLMFCAVCAEKIRRFLAPPAPAPRKTTRVWLRVHIEKRLVYDVLTRPDAAKDRHHCRTVAVDIPTADLFRPEPAVEGEVVDHGLKDALLAASEAEIRAVLGDEHFETLAAQGRAVANRALKESRRD